MDGNLLRSGSTLLIGISPDSKYNLNKNSGNFYELKFTRNSQKNLGTLDLDEIWPASSWLHLIARKNQFSSK
jgi:hypothetical protein